MRIAGLAMALLGPPMALLTLPSRTADAFCGFYIDTGGAEMFANATQVVLMREGTRTILAMQNNYEGPLHDFAMVIPVPTVLRQGDVKTLPKTLFAKVNAMSAPRLVEYWEADPCMKPEGEAMDVRNFSANVDPPKRYGVKIEAQFDVDEYKIVILSAKDSTGLDRYLRAAKYKIPDGAAPLLRPYVEAGSKFFVARVDPKKVKMVDGQAQLSPLRFHYDTDEFSLPIRLGLANSAGTQDLIVNILAPDQRYEVANYPNAFIPTNIDVKDEVRTRFGELYAALFDRTLQQNPGAVITEYAWSASSCDPCPVEPLNTEELLALGEEVLIPKPKPPPPPPPPPKPASDDEIDIEVESEIDLGLPERDFVLTRLHARYGTTGAPRDLIFRAAPPIQGGRERRYGNQPSLPTTPTMDTGTNAFQGRYIIRHPWAQPIECDDPQRGRWGDEHGRGHRDNAIGAAMDSAAAPRGQLQLQQLVAQDIPQIAVTRGVPLSPPLPGPPPRRVRAAKGCAGCNTSEAAPLGALGALALLFRRRRR